MVRMATDQELLRVLYWDSRLNSTLTGRPEIVGSGSLGKANGYMREPLDIVSRRGSLRRTQLGKRELQMI